MLSLTVHPGEYITIGDDIVVQILKTGEITRVAIEAPRELAIVRSKLVEEKGPDHDKRFVVDVLLNSNVIGKGEGRSKKNAEQMAAKEALELMGQ